MIKFILLLSLINLYEINAADDQRRLSCFYSAIKIDSDKSGINDEFIFNLGHYNSEIVLRYRYKEYACQIAEENYRPGSSFIECEDGEYYIFDRSHSLAYSSKGLLHCEIMHQR